MIQSDKGCAAQCTRFIYGYMAFAGFSIFFTLTGLIALQLVVKFGLVLDAFSFAFILYNFAVRLCLLFCLYYPHVPSSEELLGALVVCMLFTCWPVLSSACTFSNPGPCPAFGWVFREGAHIWAGKALLSGSTERHPDPGHCAHAPQATCCRARR